MLKKSWIFTGLAVLIVPVPFLLHFMKPWEPTIGQIMGIGFLALALCTSIYAAIISRQEERSNDR